jgi:hypothetical protein
MAKKVVASLQKGGGKEHTKVIKMVKSEKSGAYTFKEEIVHNDKVKEWFTTGYTVVQSLLKLPSWELFFYLSKWAYLIFFRNLKKKTSIRFKKKPSIRV